MASWRRWGLGLALAGTLAFSGCSSAKEQQAPMEEPAPQFESQSNVDAVGGLADQRAKSAPAAPSAAGAPAREQLEAKDASKPSQEQKASVSNRYIIRTGNVTLQVAKVPKAMDQVQAVAKKNGGFVSDSNVQITEGVPPTATLTVRVPSDRFDAVMTELGGVGTVHARAVNSEDVSIQFIDTQSRIRNLQKEEATIVKLLDRTGKLSEILEVERELSRVRGEIEQAQGRLRQLAALVDLATIQVTLSEKVQVASTSPWQIPAVVENAWQNAQRELADVVSKVVAGGVWVMAYVLPLLIPGLLIFWVLGLVLRALLVDRLKLMTLPWFNRLWGAAAVVIACAVAPPLLGVVVLLGAVALLAWMGSLLWARFGRSMREEA